MTACRRLFIAEKPSLGRAIADNLPGTPRRGDGHIVVGNDVVTWVFGHILELLMPEEYDPKWSDWDLKLLPIFPAEWRLKPRADAKDQLAIIKRLLKDAAEVVHAGDPDREGQLLVDEVLSHLKCRKPVKRLLLNATDPATVRRQLGAMTPNARHAGLYHAGMGRARADWLTGMNLSRLVTRALAERGVTVSIGRVQTPTLALVVRRCEAIEQFVARNFYDLVATVAGAGHPAIELAFAPKLETDRIWDPALAQALCAAAVGLCVPLTRTVARKTEAPPKLFTLPELQKFASKQFGLGAAETLRLAQELYEGQLISYPRTECPYLPAEQAGDVPDIVAALGQAADGPLAAVVRAIATPTPRKSVFDTAKVEEHHAIIPTRRVLPASLTGHARDLYRAIAMRYLLMLCPDHEFEETVYTARLNGRDYTAKGQVTTAPGWTGVAARDARNKPLPALPDGLMVTVLAATPRERETSPPKHYTEGTLIEDMASIGKYVTNEQLRAVLKEHSGIGTAATQAGIIETLKRRGYIYTEQGQLKAAPLGRSIVHNLHAYLVEPDLTAKWELDLKKIAQGELTLEAFEHNIQRFVLAMIDWAREASLTTRIQGEAATASKPRANSRGRAPASKRPARKTPARASRRRPS